MRSLCVLILVALVGAAVADPKQTLEELCRLKQKKGAAQVARLSEVRAMIELLKTNGQDVDCPEDVKVAVMALEPLIELESVCSEAAADAITGFWARYVDKRSAERASLPRPLRKFFVGLGLQVSKKCKSILVSELDKATSEKQISETDFHVVTRHIKENKRLRKIFGKKPRLEELMMIVRTYTNKDADGQQEQRTLVNMPPKSKKYFELMQERCLNKFKPIYDTLISPIVRLASIGLNYYEQSLDAFKLSPTYLEWFNVILACEPSVNYEAVLIPAEKLDANGNAAMVTFLDAEDLAELRDKTGLTLDEPAITEPVDYRTEASIDDLVVDGADTKLTKLIDGYGGQLKDAIAYRCRLFARLPSILKLLYQNDLLRLGLQHPTKKGHEKQLTKFGATKLTRRKLLALRYISIGLVAGSVLSLLVVLPHLFPVWIILGAVIIVLIVEATSPTFKKMIKNAFKN